MSAKRWISGEYTPGPGFLDPATGILSRPVCYRTATGGTVATHDFHPLGDRYQWRPAINGTTSRPWFVLRDLRPCERMTPGTMATDYLNTTTGKLARFATREAAERAAKRCNALPC